MLAEPSKLEPALVTSPVAIPIVLAVCRAVAVHALPDTLVWSHVLVQLKVPVAQSAIVIPLFCMILPVVESYRAIALSVALAGQCTSPVPSHTATSGLAGVPRPVMVVPSTDILTTGFNGSALSVFRPVTVSTVPPPPHVTHSVSKSLLLLFDNTWFASPPLGTPTPLLPCGHVKICFS